MVKSGVGWKMGRSKALLSRILCCFEAREIQNASQCPLLFCRPIAESVWQCSAFKKSALSEPIQFLLRPKSTRQDSNKRGCVFPIPFPVWSWFCWYALLIWENRRQDSILATIYKQDRFCVSLSCLVLLMCSAHTSSIWQDQASNTYILTII